ncbi:hypothetical protein [Roseibium sp.]|uniref:hypothetical protein n=1 Tax=Roseibium sp. TaxID=1936156 RepID=UPI003B518490
MLEDIKRKAEPAARTKELKLNTWESGDTPFRRDIVVALRTTPSLTRSNNSEPFTHDLSHPIAAGHA